MKFRRIGVALKTFYYEHLTNWLWRPRARRHVVRQQAQADILECYFRKYYIPALESLEAGPVEENPDEKIYSIWLQGENAAPPLVKACWASVRKHCQQKLVIIDADYIKHHLGLPETIIRKFEEGKIKPPHYADICRVELLYRYGGIWF